MIAPKEDKLKLRELFAPVRAILWDIDGTLFSSENILASTYRKAFLDFQKNTKQKIAIPSLPQILNEIGKPVKEIFKNLTPGLKTKEQEKLSLAVLAELVRLISLGGGSYYAGMPSTLSRLHKRGYLFFSASNGRYPYIEAILRASECVHYFPEIEFINYKNIKNKSELVAHILKKRKLQAQEALLVGDRQSDRDAACDNGLAFVACTYGHGHASEWKDAALLIRSLQELEEHLLGAQAT